MIEMLAILALVLVAGVSLGLYMSKFTNCKGECDEHENIDDCCG